MLLDISEKAKEFRIKGNHSISQIARELNITDSEYMMIEEGKINLNYLTVLNLSIYYGIPVSYLDDRSKKIVDSLLDNFVDGKGTRIETNEYIEYTYIESTIND